ncbi:MAG: hypothetical protein PHT49_01020 [Desulfovibrionales bacterium]|nr:hypothetical protein [Desulfovibrionales bacterium]
MNTLRQFSNKPETIPAITSWYLADLSEARGKQELFTKQAPQRLKVLRDLQSRKEIECLGRGRIGGKEIIPLKEGDKKGNIKMRSKDRRLFGN